MGGWPGGRAWLSTRAAIGRYNYAVALLDGEPIGRAQSMDVLGLARRHGLRDDLEEMISFFGQLLLGYGPEPVWSDHLLAALGPKPSAKPKVLRRAIALILASPEAQLA